MPENTKKPLIAYKTMGKLCFSISQNRFAPDPFHITFFCGWALADIGWDLALCGWDLAELSVAICPSADEILPTFRWDLAECQWDLADILDEIWPSFWIKPGRVWMRSDVAIVLSLFLTSSDKVESEWRQMKQCWRKYFQTILCRWFRFAQLAKGKKSRP